MSTAPTVTLTPGSERALLYTLAAVQFTHIMDFMILMPLGAQLMRYFDISPQQFTFLVSSYALAAALAGFAGGFFLDRVDRKRALLVLYAGFGLATLACALAPNYWSLLAARFAAGGFGGVAGSVVTAMVGDVVPPERRGRAMATVMAAFPLASVLGVPAGLALASWSEWHAPFFLLAALSGLTWILAAAVLPRVRSPRSLEHPVAQMAAMLRHPVHQRALMLGMMLVFAGGAVLPFMAPSLELNVGIPQTQIFWVYMAGGAFTFFTMPLMGRLSDRYDKFNVLAGATAVAAVTVYTVTNLPAAPLPLTLVATTLFFAGMSGRFAPAMAMITNAVDARYRGSFMAVNSSLQQAASGTATLVAGLLVTKDAAGRLVGYPRAGLVSLVAFGLTLWLAARLRAAAPHAARNLPAVNPIPVRNAERPTGV